MRIHERVGEHSGLAEKVKIVVNRMGLDGGQIGIKKAQDTMGREIYWQLPNDYRTMVEVRNNGVPLIEHNPKAGITQAITALADMLCLLQIQLELKIRAKGILMDRHGLNEADAFAFVQKTAMSARRTMRDVADEIIAGTLTP